MGTTVQVIFEAIGSFWNLLAFVISGIRLNDILDIAVMTYIIYKCIGFFRETRGGQLVKGLIVLLLMALLAQWFNMVMVKWVMVKVMDSILVAAVIIFQPELRRALEHVGTSRLGMFASTGGVNIEQELFERQIESISRAAGIMQEQKCGALMVFERNTQLGEIIATGTVVDAASSSALICNIFYPKSPLHDGGMILRDGKVYAAGCILPLTQNTELSKALGTRHRAAIGMSENSDAVVVVVSEETGTISVAVNGELRRDYDAITLRTELSGLLLEKRGEDNHSFISKFFRSLLPKKKKNSAQENDKTVQDENKQ